MRLVGLSPTANAAPDYRRLADAYLVSRMLERRVFPTKGPIMFRESLYNDFSVWWERIKPRLHAAGSSDQRDGVIKEIEDELFAPRTFATRSEIFDFNTCPGTHQFIPRQNDQRIANPLRTFCPMTVSDGDLFR